MLNKGDKVQFEIERMDDTYNVKIYRKRSHQWRHEKGHEDVRFCDVLNIVGKYLDDTYGLR